MTRRISINRRWTFRQADNASSKFLETHGFPTQVHLDLLHHGLIPDPFLAKKENDVQWVAEKAWIYRTKFLAGKCCEEEKCVLAFGGLDTYATVVLNGKEILKTEDMFIPERVDVTGMLIPHDFNELEITFESAYLVGKRTVEKYPDHRWGCWNGDPSRLAVRKAQYHYGWDWGIMSMTCGPWRPIFLEFYIARIVDLYFTTDVDQSLGSAEVKVRADIEGEADEVRFYISCEGNLVGSETVKVEHSVAQATFKTTGPRLWYPRKYGEQTLYKLEASLLAGEKPLDSSVKRFGLRRAQVVQRRFEDAVGTSFTFEINNTPIFCGGSNWIPADSFVSRISPHKYRDWVRMVADGNQVMLRVWGGGIFEHPSFYDACDEMGILVWQDFLFACGNYPAHPEFLGLVKREATANVKLLRHHPSIVIWAGNNEDYSYRESESLQYDPEDKNPDHWLKSTFPARFIYEKILPGIINELVPGTYYHSGSPFGGVDSTDPAAGDIHQWNVWHGTQEKYQDFDMLSGRFITEFGMEAFPDIKTVNSFFLDGIQDIDRYAGSSTVDFHNKAVGHERRLALYLAENIRYKSEPFEYYVYCTQLIQAECLATAFKVWKRQWKGPSREYCSGALAWQTNDSWPCTSWSIIDYNLRPKLAYYAIKRAMSPITIDMKRTVETVPADKYTHANIETVYKIQLWVCNLELKAHRLKIIILTTNLDAGETKVHSDLSKTLEIPPNCSTEIMEFEIPVSHKHADEELQTVVAAKAVGLTEAQITSSINWPEPLKYAHLPKPKDVFIQHFIPRENLRKTRAGWPSGLSFEASTLMLKSDTPLKGVMLEYDDRGGEDGVSFEDNGFDIIAESLHSIKVWGLQREQERRLQVTYLGCDGVPLRPKIVS